MILIPLSTWRVHRSTQIARGRQAQKRASEEAQRAAQSAAESEAKKTLAQSTSASSASSCPVTVARTLKARKPDESPSPPPHRYSLPSIGLLKEDEQRSRVEPPPVLASATQPLAFVLSPVERGAGEGNTVIIPPTRHEIVNLQLNLEADEYASYIADLRKVDTSEPLAQRGLKSHTIDGGRRAVTVSLSTENLSLGDSHSSPARCGAGWKHRTDRRLFVSRCELPSAGLPWLNKMGGDHSTERIAYTQGREKSMVIMPATVSSGIATGDFWPPWCDVDLTSETTAKDESKVVRASRLNRPVFIIRNTSSQPISVIHFQWSVKR